MMTVRHARAVTLYVLIGLNLVMLAATVAIATHVSHLGRDVVTSRDQQREGCERGNVLREATRANTLVLARMAQIVVANASNDMIVAEFAKTIPALEARLRNPRFALQACEVLFPR